MRLLVVLVILSLTACGQTVRFGSTKTVVVRQAVNELMLEPIPGTQKDVWAEPMYDTVRVPAAIDPKGIYYRPSHSTVVEIRQGKYQKVQYPDYDGNYSNPK